MSKNLKDTIDRMVEDSIRRVLPGIMNEVLLKTIANSGVIREQAPARRAEPAQVAAPKRQAPRRPSSLEDILDDSAGSEFYTDPRVAMAEATRDEEPQAPRAQGMAQRIQALPPALQHLAEGVNLDDDGGEMWGDEQDSVPSGGSGPPLDQAARAVGLDFSRMMQVAKVTESKKAPKMDAQDRAANAQFDQMRLKRMREQLNGGKPVE